MKKIVALLGLFLTLLACKNNEAKVEQTAVIDTIPQEVTYTPYGDTITTENALTSTQMLEKYKEMKAGDTVNVKFIAQVNSVCQKKGCWMRLNLGDKESFVKFKDYGFFMPLDLASEEVIVEGKAFVEETSVEDLKHFALDAGKTQEEIDAITAPEVTYSFLSSGVLVPQTK